MPRLANPSEINTTCEGEQQSTYHRNMSRLPYGRVSPFVLPHQGVLGSPHGQGIRAFRPSSRSPLRINNKTGIRVHNNG
jgi:hypothetical protein